MGCTLERRRNNSKYFIIRFEIRRYFLNVFNDCGTMRVSVSQGMRASYTDLKKKKKKKRIKRTACILSIEDKI